MGALYTEVYEADLQQHLRNPEASFALSCWELARGERDVPDEADLLRHKIDWLKPDLMIIRKGADGELFYEAYGANIAAGAGFDMTGRSLAEFKGMLGDFYRACYSLAAGTRKPVATVHRLGNYNERPMWERVILPVRESAGGLAFYVINRLRKLQDDFALISSRTKGNGVIALQFTRDADGCILDALITGANPAALAMTNRRLDELLDRSIRDCFPGVIHFALWDRYIEVAATKTEQMFHVDYRMDGVDDAFDVKLYPFRDGVAIDFRVVHLVDRAGAAGRAAPSLAVPVEA